MSNNILSQVSKNKFPIIIFFISIYFIFNFLSGDRGLIEFYKKHKLLEEYKTKNQNLKKEVYSLEKRNEFISVKINQDYLDQLYRDYFVVGKKGEKIYIIQNSK
jgi:cell division protein DivIC